ncbi:hypothetical protein ACS0TY_013792 [Phlomoides rotata]
MMIYYWPRTLLKKVESSMRNFLWTGDINKKNNSCSISWARCCSPHDEGGLGIRSLRISNDSFICKLGWDILCNRSQDIALLYAHYIMRMGSPRNYNRVSSIWPDRLGVPAHFAATLTNTISDFFFDDQWNFDYEFFMKHTDVVRDILSVHISWDSDSRATRFHFSKELGYLWRVTFITAMWSIWIARNKCIFEKLQPFIHRCLVFIQASIREADLLTLGYMDGSVRELAVTVIRWKPPHTG